MGFFITIKMGMNIETARNKNIMHKNIKVLLMIIALLPVLLIGRGLYATSDYHISQCYWKGCSGETLLRDVLVLDDSMRLKKGVITLEGKPVARIVLKKYRPYADNIIVVENELTSALGMYWEKGCN